ncbi:protein kintoun [Pseudophryne corroboree]|uniref:protein kintoun n=1 Tax=Pseudophryne corroboree TaxID=495146 RepID=UPI0030817715
MAAARLEELSVTPEELERFRAAFQDVRFRELFAQYAEEIADPENRRRYEREISEMERERGVDVQFLHPQPGHVLQSSVGGRQACYLNVCSNPSVCKPHCVPATDEEGRAGQQWSLPCALSPAREELGPEGVREVIYDVVFHPDTLRLATKSDKFLAMVNLTALDTVSQNFSVTLDTCNVSTLDMTYKGHPQASVLRKPSAGVSPKPQDPSDPLHFPYPYDALGGHKKSDHSNQDQLQKIQPAPRERRPSQEPTIPHYTIRHRSYVDIQDYRDARDSAPSPVPKELVITVDLPLLSSASEVNLHIEGKALSLESKRPAYKLQIKLPYLVADDQGTAHFNKTKRQLVITVPVVQQNVLKLMQDQGSKRSCSPSSDVQEISQSVGALETPPPDEDPKKVVELVPLGDSQNSLAKDPPECPIFTCSQDATSLTLVIHVKDVDENSITSEVGCYQCELRFCVKHTNAAYVLFVQFLPQYNLNTDDIAVHVSTDNTVIELTKSCECFGPWKNLYFGVNSNSLQERRFINEDNVTEFLESGLRPSTIPWSTLEDQPLINVLEMTDERTHIRVTKPELEEERYLSRREQSADHNEVKEQVGSQSDNTGLSDTDAIVEDGPQSAQATCPSCTIPAQSPDQLLVTEHATVEDQGLCFKDLAPRELDEDDLPDGTGHTQCPVLNSSSPTQILKEVSAADSSVNVISDHKTQCAFNFENTLLFDLD